MRIKQPTARDVPSLNRTSCRRRSSTDLLLFNRRAGLPVAILTGILALVTGCTSTGTAIRSGQASFAIAAQIERVSDALILAFRHYEVRFAAGIELAPILSQSGESSAMPIPGGTQRVSDQNERRSLSIGIANIGHTIFGDLRRIVQRYIF
jgi:hypothetical protein